MLLNSLSLNTSLACYSVNSQSFIFYYASSFLRLLQKQPALVSSKIFQLKISLNFKTSSQIFSVLDSKGPKEIVQKVEPSSSSRASQETEQSHPQGKRSQPNESSDKPPPSKKRKWRRWRCWMCDIDSDCQSRHVFTRRCYHDIRV
jgi:hypothetical protein